MEIKSITALMSMMADVDENGDGVLQFDEFADLLLKIDPMFTSQVPSLVFARVGVCSWPCVIKRGGSPCRPGRS
eukprot:2771352-Rhodomonas_salina.1